MIVQAVVVGTPGTLGRGVGEAGRASCGQPGVKVEKGSRVWIAFSKEACCFGETGDPG